MSMLFQLLKHVQSLAEIKRELSLMAGNISGMEQVVSEADSSVWEKQAMELESNKVELEIIFANRKTNLVN